MTMRIFRSTLLGLLVGCAVVMPAAGQGTPTKVYPYPGDASWFPMGPEWNILNPFDPDAQITGAQPYGGNGSLDLNLYGAPYGQPGFFDWAFYGTLAQNQRGGWGTLGSMTAVEMYWWREAVAQTYSPVANDPWLAQTPVLRLLLGDQNGLLYGELVWEQFYTENVATPYNQWVFDDMMTQNFWHNSGTGNIAFGPDGAYVNGYDGGESYLVNDGCTDQLYPTPPLDPSQTDWHGGLVIGRPGQWSDLSFCTNELTNAYVWGVAVGLGSRWPDNYMGYVDYVRLDFDDPTNDINAVYANFELPMTPVPEPGTVALLATGLLGLGGAQLLRRRRSK
jgi:hypothetical protein